MDDPPRRHIFTSGISRSGTTLLTTVLDSHPDVSMGYELLHEGLPPPGALAELVDRALAEGADTPRRCGNQIKDWGHPSAGVLVKRCARALVEPADLSAILRSLAGDGDAPLDGLDAQLTLAMAVVDAKRKREGTAWAGFKVTPASLDHVSRRFPGSGFLLIVRDPRDVAASQLERGNDYSLRRIARGWCRAGDCFRRFLDAPGPGRVALVRYEDLVTEPQVTLQAAFSAVGLPFAPAVLRFFDSKASVHRRGISHANAESLRRDFFTTSVGRWRRDLDERGVRRVERRSAALMAAFGYARSSDRTVPAT